MNDNILKTKTTTAGTSTTTNWQCPWYHPQRNIEYGWECPRCGKINAPWITSCDCNQNWSITWTANKLNVKPNQTWHENKEWWKEITCHDDSILNNPTTYQVGGSDYRTGDTYVNVSGAQSNKVESNSVTTAWNSGRVP